MKISKNFCGGNIEVLSVGESEVVVERELRDSTGDWFYWAFCVEDACPQEKEQHTITFTFPQKRRVGKFGAAVSHNLIHWQWTHSKVENGFSYTFHPKEKVYFSFCFIYSDQMLRNFLKEHNIEAETLCLSRKGRPVPLFRIGTGENVILFTSRHHACESTGTFLMQGIAEECLKNPLKEFSFLFVPFVDYDGVMDGDPGKNRYPHDHNRDYGTEPAIYPEVRALRDLADSGRVYAAFDLHSPGFGGKEHDEFYFLKCPDTESSSRFYAYLKECSECDSESLQYGGTWDFPYGGSVWNDGSSPCMRNYFLPRVISGVAVTAETTYSGTLQNPFTAERAIRLGNHFYKSLVRSLLLSE